MGTTANTFPTYEEAKAKNPNLDLGSYGLHALIYEQNTNPEALAYAAKHERSMAQPSTTIRSMAITMDTGIFLADELMRHSSPLVRSKTRKEIKSAIEALTLLLKA